MIIKLLILNIFILNSLFEINKKAAAEETIIKSSLLHKTEIIENNKRFIDTSKIKFNHNSLKNNISNIDVNNNLNINFPKKNSINLYKSSLKEKIIIKDKNVLNNTSINKLNSFQKNFNSNFKDSSSTFLSPFGGHVPRAPDESLKSCQTQECYE